MNLTITINKLNKNEKKALVVSTGAILLFFIIQAFRDTTLLHKEQPEFLMLHTVLELFSIFISMSIFFQAWLTFSHIPSLRRMTIGLLFLQVGAFDLFHTLLYKGMLFIQDDQSVGRATWFWILARLTESAGLGLVFWKNDNRNISKIEKNGMFIAILTSIAVFSYLIINQQIHLPLLFIEGKGVTPLKVGLEYAIGAIHLVTMVIVFQLYKRSKNEDFLVVIAGLVFLLLGELVFTLYKHVHGLDNLLGHVYKVVGYSFLFRGIFFPQYKQIFEEKEYAQTMWHEAEEKLIENEKKMTTLIIEAQEEERKRVARELHDGIGQGLYSILMTIKMIRNTQKDRDLIDQLKTAEEMAATSMKDVKRIATQLRPSALDDLGLIPAMRSFCEQFENTHHIKVEYHFARMKERLSHDLETALYRIFQESMNNTAKYSRATMIKVHLSVENEKILLNVTDNGVGFCMEEVLNRENKGIGLYSMQERASLLHGSCSIFSEVDKGTSITISIPICFL